MRTTTVGKYEVFYPDEIGFAFNPSMIKVVGNEQDVFTFGVNIPLSEGQQMLTFRSFGGTAIADVSLFVQEAFRQDGVADNMQYDEANTSKRGKTISFELIIDGEQFTFDTFFVWGALEMGGKDIFNAPRKLDYFKGYPFSWGVYVDEPITLQVQVDGERTQTIALNGEAMYEVPLSFDGGNSALVGEDTGKIVETTFTYVFGNTFSKAYAPLIERVTINIHEECQDDECVYLRWVDGHGFYRYYLFGKSSENITASGGEYQRNDFRLWDDTLGYGYNAGRMQNFQRGKTLNLYAALLDDDRWKGLSTIGTSPIVEMYCGKIDGKHTWMSVAVQGATYARSKEELQDFEVTIELPTTQMQGL